MMETCLQDWYHPRGQVGPSTVPMLKGATLQTLLKTTDYLHLWWGHWSVQAINHWHSVPGPLIGRLRIT